MELINIDDYSLGLVGYLYKCYNDERSALNYPATPLPLELEYACPKPKDDWLLKAQCIVNRTLRDDFFPVFQAVYRQCCHNVGLFQEFLENARFHELIEQFPVEYSTAMKLLARNALVTEFVLYCFKMKCYVLSNILRGHIKDFLELEEEFQDIFSTVTAEDVSMANASYSFSSSLAERDIIKKVEKLPTDGYTQLQNLCRAICKTPNHRSLAIFTKIGETFRNNQMQLITERAQEPAARAQEQLCDTCGAQIHHCSIHLQEFIEGFNAELTNRHPGWLPFKSF